MRPCLRPSLFAAALLACALALADGFSSASPSKAAGPAIAIPRGQAIRVDGKIGLGEWQNAIALPISVAPGWIVHVLVKHDEANLYVAFVNLQHGSSRLYPEVMIDSPDLRSASWLTGQWWLHASYNLCEGDGAFNVYRRDGTFLCSHSKSGWEANNPPQPGGVTEFRISFAKLQLASRPGTVFGLAFDVTNATGDAKQIWRFWPAAAQLAVPRTWGEAVLR
ncbi:MAG TPA: hypothetical protein VGS20_12480 [Candidatus Acidoferrales bacterium]|nr:hypothetical protein [Candidatus Acidoferrales bacterium]